MRGALKHSELLAVAALLVCALVPRLILLLATNFGIDSDEAIVGLMAKHFAEGRPWTVFYYGQDYMGSLEAMLASGLFTVAGASNAALKWVPLFFSLLHVLLTYELAKRFLSRNFALLAGFLTAIGPSALITWSGMARGGFIELVVLGSLALVLSLDILEAQTWSWARALLLGLVLGLGWWVNNQIIFYLLPIGTVIGFHVLRSQGLLRGLWSGAVIFFGFLAGGAPFWYANLAVTPRFATFKVLFGGTAERHTLRYLLGFVSEALPIIAGARRFWSYEDVFPGATLVVGVLYALVLVTFIYGHLRSTRSYVHRAQALLFLLFGISVGLIFSLSSFGWLSQAPRYVLPLYSVLFVVAAAACESWAGTGTKGRGLATAVIFALFAVHLASNYLGPRIAPGQPVVFAGQRVAEDHSELYSWLQARGYHHIHTNYWIGYRTAFETNETVTFTRFGRPRSLRIPEYEAQTEAPNDAVYVLVPAEAALLTAELAQFGFSFQQTIVGQYVVVDNVRRKWQAGAAIALAAEQVTVSSKPEWKNNIADGDIATRWGSGMPQQPGMSVEVNLEVPMVVNGVELDLGAFVQDAPRRLRIEGRIADRAEWVTLFDSQGTKVFNDLQDQEFAEIPPDWQITFRPVRLTAIRFIQAGQAPVFDWSIAELKMYGSREE